MSFESIPTISEKLRNKGYSPYRITNTNPTINDIAPSIGYTWINTDTGELFTYLGQDAFGNGRWRGSFGTATSNAIPMDVFNDGSCIAFWRFEDNANDDGGNYNGNWVGTPQYDTGVIGKGVKFNGQVYIHSNSIFTSTPSYISVSVWVNFLDSSSGSFFVMDVTTDGVYYCWEYSVHLTKLSYDVYPPTGGGVGYFMNLNTNTFYHVALVKSLTNIKFFINGTLVFTGSNSESNSSSGYFIIGQRGSYGISNYPPLNCICDNLRIFNRALTDTEVQYLYNLEKP